MNKRWILHPQRSLYSKCIYMSIWSLGHQNLDILRLPFWEASICERPKHVTFCTRIWTSTDFMEKLGKIDGVQKIKAVMNRFWTKFLSISFHVTAPVLCGLGWTALSWGSQSCNYGDHGLVAIRTGDEARHYRAPILIWVELFQMIFPKGMND